MYIHTTHLTCQKSHKYAPLHSFVLETAFIYSMMDFYASLQLHVATLYIHVFVVCWYMCVGIWVYAARVCVRERLRVCLCVLIRVRVCVCACVCVHVCVHVYISPHLHLHIVIDNVRMPRGAPALHMCMPPRSTHCNMTYSFVWYGFARSYV